MSLILKKDDSDDILKSQKICGNEYKLIKTITDNLLSETKNNTIRSSSNSPI